MDVESEMGENMATEKGLGGDMETRLGTSRDQRICAAAEVSATHFIDPRIAALLGSLTMTHDLDASASGCKYSSIFHLKTRQNRF